MKHEIKFSIPFVAVVDDETALGAMSMLYATSNFELFESLIGGAVTDDPKFDEYLAYANERSDGSDHDIFVRLDKDALAV